MHTRRVSSNVRKIGFSWNFRDHDRHVSTETNADGLTEDFEIVLEDFESPLSSEPDCMDDWENDDGSEAASCAATLTTAAKVHDTEITAWTAAMAGTKDREEGTSRHGRPQDAIVSVRNTSQLPNEPDDEIEFLGVTYSEHGHRGQWPDVEIAGMPPDTPSDSQKVTAGPNEAKVQRVPSESAPISVPLTPPPLPATFHRAGRTDTPSRRSSASGTLKPPEQEATLRQAKKSKLLEASAAKPPVRYITNFGEAHLAADGTSAFFTDVLGVNYTFEQLDMLCETVNGETIETRIYQCKTCMEAAKHYGMSVDLPRVKTVNGYFVDVDPGRPRGNTHLCTRNFNS